MVDQSDLGMTTSCARAHFWLRGTRTAIVTFWLAREWADVVTHLSVISDLLRPINVKRSVPILCNGAVISTTLKEIETGMFAAIFVAAKYRLIRKFGLRVPQVTRVLASVSVMMCRRNTDRRAFSACKSMREVKSAKVMQNMYSMALLFVDIRRSAGVFALICPHFC